MAASTGRAGFAIQIPKHWGAVVTTALMRGADLIGRPVVDADSGSRLAEVRDVVFDPSRGAITGFTLRKPGLIGRKIKQVLPITAVRSVGTDAVMVGSNALANPEDVPDEAAGDPNSNVLGDRVITESGRVLGQLRDVIILGGPTPRVVGFEIGGGPPGDGLIPILEATGLSGSALIVPDAFEQRIRTDLTGLAAELAALEEDRA